MKKLVFILLIFPSLIAAQEELLNEIDTNSVKNDFETAAFKGLKIVNFESTKMVSNKELYFVVSHRFGSIETGIKDFFGLDQAVTRLNFIYGISDGINIGVSRSSFEYNFNPGICLVAGHTARSWRSWVSGLPV